MVLFCSIDNQTSYRSGSVHGELSIQLCKSSVCQNECSTYKSLRDGATYAVNENIHLDLTMSANVSVSSSFETEVIEAFLSCSRDRNYPSKAYLIQGYVCYCVACSVVLPVLVC